MIKANLPNMLQIWNRDISAARNMMELVLATARGEPRLQAFQWPQAVAQDIQLDVAAALEAAAPPA